MRRGQPLPRSRIVGLLGLVLTLAAVAAGVLVIVA
jgi:uncharacterized membrane protein YidH (DUF202 family)